MTNIIEQQLPGRSNTMAAIAELLNFETWKQ